MRPRNPYPHCYWDRHRETWRLKPPGGKQSTLKREDGTPFLYCQWGGKEFADAYREVMANVEPMPKKGLGVTPGTFDAAGRDYFRSDRFVAKLGPITKKARRYQVERFLDEHGSKRVVKLKRRHVRAMLDDLAASRGNSARCSQWSACLSRPLLRTGFSSTRLRASSVRP